MSVRHYLLLITALVTLIPIAVFGIWPHSKAYDDIIDDVSERNLLVAENVRRALDRYNRDVRAAFGLLARTVAEGRGQAEAQILLDNLNFRHICLADPQTRRVRFSITGDRAKCPDFVPEDRMARFLKTVGTGGPKYTGVLRGPDGNPAIFLVDRIEDMIAIGAIGTDYFVTLAKDVSFGEQGHATIVDQYGRLLAHPMEDWWREIRDISNVPVVRQLVSGGAGTMIFYSPAMKQEMIAGFASVSGPGWGVMVPQPLAELQARAADVRRHALGVIVAGVLAGAIISWIVSGYIAHRIRTVSGAVRAMAEGDRETRVRASPKMEPRELSELSETFNMMAEQVERSSREQSDALARAEAANRAKSDFLASISHELRTPLNAILGFSEAIKSEVFGEITNRKYVEYASDIHQSGEHLHALIKDLLDMSKVEAGLADLEERLVAPRDIVSKSLTFVEFRGLARGIAFEETISEADVRIKVDERMMVQALSNLLSNAVKFSHHGGVVEIVTELRADGGFEFRVVDNGIGLESQNLGKVFEPFWQENIASRNPQDGIGLGLSIVRQLMDLHDGKVAMEARIGEGTVVTLMLPPERISDGAS